MPSEGIQGDEWAAYVALICTARTNAGSPVGREPYGDGVPVVVAGVATCQGGRESRPQGRSCAVSLGVGSLSQRVGVRKEEASGSPTLPGRETARGQQHGGKAWSVVKALMALPRKARVIWRRPDCLKPSSQGWKCAFSDIQRLERSHQYQANPLCFAPILPAGGR